MSPDEAKSALVDVKNTEGRLAEKMRWPFSRHAMFGLAEGLIVMGIGLRTEHGIAAIGAGVALIASLFYQDKRRHGMFVSGFQGKRTRPLTVALVLSLLVFVAGALLAKRAGLPTYAPVLIGAATAIVCTWFSIRWERIYRAELREGTER